MTRKPPEPVKAWAVYTHGRLVPFIVHRVRTLAELDCTFYPERHYERVFIVPVSGYRVVKIKPKGKRK